MSNNPSLAFQALNTAITKYNLAAGAAKRAQDQGDKERASEFASRTEYWYGQAESAAAALDTRLTTMENGTVTAELFLNLVAK
jgi:hypothetical protein